MSTRAFRPLAPDFPFFVVKPMKNLGFRSQNAVHFGVPFGVLLGVRFGVRFGVHFGVRFWVTFPESQAESCSGPEQEKRREEKSRVERRREEKRREE